MKKFSFGEYSTISNTAEINSKLVCGVSLYIIESTWRSSKNIVSSRHQSSSSPFDVGTKRHNSISRVQNNSIAISQRMDSSTPLSLSITISYQGQSVPLDSVITTTTTGTELYQCTRRVLGLSSETASLKLICQGKRVQEDENPLPFRKTNKSALKILVMSTSRNVVADLSTQRSDPTIRGFDQEKHNQAASGSSKSTLASLWGPNQQDRNYKFCRFEACTWQSFGHRPTDTTPHAFRAMQLLEMLAMDPGIVAVMKERELVVGTLGEMDPIDDRIMQTVQQQGAGAGTCLLGYNTNAGTRIDIKLRTEDLKSFRPYPELVTTLLHELSHNWVGDHNLLFWTNFAQMRAEYLTKHRAMQSNLENGKTTAEVAGIHPQILDNIPETILKELVVDMAPHGLHPAMIEAPIRQRCHELEQQFLQGKTLGGTTTSTSGSLSARERALAAAEQRRKQQEETNDENGSDATRP